MMIWRLMRGMLLHKGDDVRDDSGGCLGDGLNRQMRSRNSNLCFNKWVDSGLHKSKTRRSSLFSRS